MLRNLKTYHRPTDVEEAVALAQSSPASQYLGGGAWLVAQGSPNLETVVDLQNLGLNQIESDMDGARIGATASLQDIIDHPGLRDIANGILAEASEYTQSRTLREQGTLGGTLIVAGSADPLTTALLVLDTEIRYADPATHTAPFISFVAYRDRLVKTRVLLLDVFIKRPPSRSAAAFEVVGRSPKDKPIVCAAAYIAVAEGLCAEIKVAVGGANPKPTRLHKTEHLLKGQLLAPEKVTRALDISISELTPEGDFRGSETYRLEMARVLAQRAISSAWGTARQG